MKFDVEKYRLSTMTISAIMLFSLFQWGCPPRNIRRDPKVVYTEALGFCNKAHRRSPPRKKPLFYLAMINERLEKWEQAIVARQRYIAQTQTGALQGYLSEVLSKMKKHYDKQGLKWVLARLAAKTEVTKQMKFGRKKLAAIGWGGSSNVKRLNKADVNNLVLLRMYAKVAEDYRMLSKFNKADDYSMITLALAEEMERHGISAVEGRLPIVQKNAESRFFLSERRRRVFQKMQLSKELNQNNARLKEIIAFGVLLSRDYAEVVKVRVPEWALAAAFRQAEIYTLLYDKVNGVTKPENVSQDSWVKYKKTLDEMGRGWLKKAKDGFATVLQKAISLEVYTPWIKKCEQAYQKVNGLIGKNTTQPAWWAQLQSLKKKKKEEQVTTLPEQILEMCKSF